MELGFLKLEDIVKNSNLDKDITFDFKLGRDKNLSSTKGQLNKKLEGDGIVRMEDQHCIYEGQFQNGKPHGYGRRIYFNGESHLGFWREGAWVGKKYEPKKIRRVETVKSLSHSPKKTSPSRGKTPSTNMKNSQYSKPFAAKASKGVNSMSTTKQGDPKTPVTAKTLAEPPK